MTDNEIIKALECCINADCVNCPKWSEEWYSGMCSDFLPMILDLINRQKAEIERLTTLAELGNIRANGYRAMRDKAKNAKAEAIKEFAEEIFAEIDKIIDEVYNRHIFGNNDLDDIEHEAIMNFSADISYRIDELKQKYSQEVRQ